LQAAAFVFGTPAYRAPESLLPGYQLQPAADMWSLGVCMHVWVFGRLPFDGATPYAIYRAIQQTPLALPDAADARVSQPLLELLGVLLVKNHAHRISAAQLLCHPWLTQCGAAPRPALGVGAALGAADDSPMKSRLNEGGCAAEDAGESLCRLSAVFDELHLAPGERLFSAGEPIDTLYLIADGELEARSQGGAAVSAEAPCGSSVAAHTSATVEGNDDDDDALVWGDPPVSSLAHCDLSAAAVAPGRSGSVGAGTPAQWAGVLGCLSLPEVRLSQHACTGNSQQALVIFQRASVHVVLCICIRCCFEFWLVLSISAHDRCAPRACVLQVPMVPEHSAADIAQPRVVATYVPGDALGFTALPPSNTSFVAPWPGAASHGGCSTHGAPTLAEPQDRETRGRAARRCTWTCNGVARGAVTVLAASVERVAALLHENADMGSTFESLRQRCIHDHTVGATLAQLQLYAPALLQQRHRSRPDACNTMS
jgi:Protein kinase domain